MPLLVKISEGAIATDRLFDNGLLFEVHPPQRRFKWKKQQIEQLWADISNAQKDKRDSYFLGTLLLVPTEQGKVSVIDGQQRLTTLSLLLAVLRDLCSNFPNLRRRADGIQELISRVDNDGRPVGALVVTLQEPDNSIHVKLTKEPGSTSGPIPGKSRLASAAKLLKERAENHINAPDPEQSLRELCEYVQSRIRFLPLEVQSEGDGYLVFDTTNTRGLRLSPAEALKARLATIAREDKNLSDELIQEWNTVAKTLEESIEFADPQTEAIDVMDDYLHAVWCSKEGYATKHAIDQQIASRLTRPDLVRAFVEDLDTYCASYLAVRAPSGKSWLNEDLKELKHLNKQSFSFLTMVHKHAAERFQEAVSLVLSLQIRNITVGPQQAHAFEKEWPAWAGHVREGRTDQAFNEIRSHMVSDEDFEKRFSEVVVSSPATARHLLRRLDPISQPGSGVQPMDVHVEHILPRAVVTKLSDGKHLTSKVRRWIEDLGHDIPETREGEEELGNTLKPYLNMLGNQALLNSKYNQAAKDSQFMDKSKFYATQALEFTKSLAEYEVWGPSQIRARQKEMARRAIKIWPK